MNTHLKNKVIIITGASSGIGQVTAELLYKYKADVVLVARNKEKLEKISKELSDALFIVTDITKSNEIENMINIVMNRYDKIDVLINNAGRGTVWKTVENIDINEFKDILDVNVMGQIMLMKKVIPIMRKQGHGSIINIGSGSIYIKKEGASVYPGTKVLFNHISKIAQIELKKDNIKVSIVHPYITKTNFFENIKNENNESVSSLNDFMNVADEPIKVAEKIIEAIETGVEEINMCAGRLNIK